ncbi:MAG: arginine--tRNA ligase [Candidatus Methanodesulfokora sp.]
MLDKRDPLSSIELALSEEISRVVNDIGISLDKREIKFDETPDRSLGHMGTSIGFKLAKEMRRSPEAALKEIIERMNKVEGVENFIAKGGYLNVKLDVPLISREVIEAATKGHLGRGLFSGNVMVEHTSANPVHPLHIGSGRNSVIGDTLARILSFIGYNVRRHYLVNDCGLQSAYIALGKSIINDKPKGKVDHWYGLIYAAVNQAIELKKGNKEAEENLRRIRERDPELVDSIVSRIMNMEDPEKEVYEILRRYQKGEREIKSLLRSSAEEVIGGFMQTLRRIGVEHDEYDWESDMVWSGLVEKVALMLKPYVSVDDGAMYLDMNKAREKGVKVPENLPDRFYLSRSDGTWLYTMTDIAYSYKKLVEIGVDRCYNVIGAEQTMEQQQVKVGVALLGLDPDRIVHLGYELVSLAEGEMSGRRGIYITVDEVLDETAKRASKLVAGRDVGEDVSEKVTVGAFRYAMLSIDPKKKLQFSWNRVLNLEENSGPFIQYSYTRAASILRKAGYIPEEYDTSLLSSRLEEDLVLLMARIPKVLRDSVNLLRPDLIVQHANEMAKKFNKFYEEIPVISSEKNIRDARLKLVEAFKESLGSLMDIAGIPRMERM